MAGQSRLTFRWAAAAVAVVLSLGSSIAAHAATPAGWRLVQVVPGPPAGQTALADVTATGPKNAWAVGSTCPAICSGFHLLVVHWDGKAWRQLDLPAAMRPDHLGEVIGASSPGNAWIFNGSGSQSTRERVIHFSAGQWSSFRLPAGVFITGAAVFSTSNAWAFGQGPKAGEQYNLRYDGHSWRRVALPVAVDSVSAASATDIWASGAKSAGPHSTATVEVAMHWNGRTWATVPFPKIKPPAGWTEGAHLSLALGPRNVWGQYELSNMGGCCRAGGLLHWDGSAWHRVSIPTAISVFAGNVAADGHGGLWLQGGNGLSNSFFHYAAGHWRRYSEPVPSEQLLGSIDLAAIPGTHSVWGVSWIGPNSTTDQSTQAAIVKFGP